MVKVEAGKGRLMLQASGDLAEISADIAHVISGIYCQMMKYAPGNALAFRDIMIHVVADSDTPIWDESHTPDVSIGFAAPMKRKEGDRNA